MLTMLTVTEDKKRPFPISLIKKILPPRTDGYMKRIGYASYINIECELKNGVPDWRMVNSNTLDCSGRILLPVGMECPENSGLTRYKPTRFLRCLYSNLALETLLNMNNSPADRSVVLYGREAELSLILPQLAAISGSIKIITSRPQAIEKKVREVEAQTGITIIVSDKSDASSSTILLAPSGGAGVICTEGVELVISPDRPSSSHPLWVRSVSIDIPSILEDIYTPQYDILEMAGAFCEIAGMETLSRISPNAVTQNGDILTPCELAKLCINLQ